ncbi:MAG TPA: hypothetical protein VGN72_06525 [Tepidisphaeraceae bacterium]|jgi:hypothetical protein|nr:hypothetical protein [Tepidisphaeraceae bacterium]
MSATSALAALSLSFEVYKAAAAAFDAWRRAARMSGALTPEQDAAFDREIEEMLTADYAKTDAQLAAEGRPRVPVAVVGDEPVQDEPVR